MARTSGVTISDYDYHGWPAKRVSRGLLEITLVPQVGGRVMQLSWGGTDLLFVNSQFRGLTEPVEKAMDLHATKREMGFRLWGGEKTWLAPQDCWTDGVPFLDLDSGQYDIEILAQELDLVAVRMMSPICRETGVQVIRTMTMKENGRGMEFVHELFNASNKPVEWGIWSVAQFLKPGSVYLPLRPDSRHPKGLKTFVNEGRSDQVRDRVVHELFTMARIDCQQSDAFKFGVDATEGWVLGLVERPGSASLGYITSYEVDSRERYGHECSAEVYSSDSFPYFEIEVHSPLFKLTPGERGILRETRVVIPIEEHPDDEDEVRELVTNYLVS